MILMRAIFNGTLINLFWSLFISICSQSRKRKQSSMGTPSGKRSRHRWFWNTTRTINSCLNTIFPKGLLLTLNMLNCFKDYIRCIHTLYDIRFCPTEKDQIHNGATLHVAYPIVWIPFLLMPWGLKSPGHKQAWYFVSEELFLHQKS